MRREELLLLDILERVREVASAVRRTDRGAFTEDHHAQAAVLWPLVIIGEAAARLPDEVRSAHADVPWQRIQGFRNLALHAYESIDLNQVWNIATHDVPSLGEQVHDILRHSYPLVLKALDERHEEPGA